MQTRSRCVSTSAGGNAGASTKSVIAGKWNGWKAQKILLNDSGANQAGELLPSRMAFPKLRQFRSSRPFNRLSLELLSNCALIRGEKTFPHTRFELVPIIAVAMPDRWSNSQS